VLPVEACQRGRAGVFTVDGSLDCLGEATGAPWNGCLVVIAGATGHTGQAGFPAPGHSPDFA
jgi:hypothetical protein